jgi:hypothetical protein
MSGTFTSRVNRYWDKSQSNFSAAAFFWEWLSFINSLPNVTWKGYGTGKSQTGVTPPSAWLNWDPTSDPIPWSDNSWFVFEQTLASRFLDEGGFDPWQAKLQVCMSAGFDDCNVADTDYDYEGQTYSVFLRTCPTGGWDSTALDFTPGTSEVPSNNFSIFRATNDFYYLDLVGDNDSIFWKGSAFSLLANAKSYARGGYLGIINPRSGSISYPFFLSAGEMRDIPISTGTAAVNTKNTGVSGSQWSSTGSVMQWPSYSLWKDKTKVSTHIHDPWDSNTIGLMTPHPANAEDIVFRIQIAQAEADLKYSIIGEYRLIASTGYDFAHHETFPAGTDDWIEICASSATYGGIAMEWPAGTSPDW